MKQNICSLLGIKYPIIQGAMGHVATADLAAAVSNAGGLGTLASADFTVEELRQEIRKTKQLTKKPFAVNIPILNSKPEFADVVIEEDVKVVVTSAGNPAPYYPKWKNHGIKLMCVVATVKHAVKMEKLGADVIIAEGSESGGKIGHITTFPLVPMVVDAVSIPVVAAGGIADGRGIGAAFILGAAGVQLGTRFLFAAECPVHHRFRELIIRADASDVGVTGRPHKGGEVRMIKNKLFQKSLALEDKGCTAEDYNRIFTGSLFRAIRQGDVENGSPMAGLVVGMLNQIQTSEEIIRELIEEYNALPILGNIPFNP